MTFQFGASGGSVFQFGASGGGVPESAEDINVGEVFAHKGKSYEVVSMSNGYYTLKKTDQPAPPPPPPEEVEEPNCAIIKIPIGEDFNFERWYSIVINRAPADTEAIKKKNENCLYGGNLTCLT